jgi:hypothetical protein
MKKFVTLIAISILHLNAFSQSPEKVLKKIGNNPIYFIDSVKVNYEELQKHDSKEIASMNVLTGKEAKEIAGEDGKDGVIYIETIPFAIKRFKRYFCSKSPEYTKIISTSNNDTTVQYILNKKVLHEGYEGNLSLIDDKVFKEIKILSKDELIKDYGIIGKEYGVAILSKVPDDLYHGKKKF